MFSSYALSENQLTTLLILGIICGVAVLYCFVVGTITKNYSQMDKLWSILPIVYVWVVAIRSGFNLRSFAIALIVTVWGIRLTYNFARKGAYSLRFWEGKEDYRWKIVQSNKFFSKPYRWVLFNLLFISFYQNALVLGICLPSLVVMESSAAFGIIDLFALAFALIFLFLETSADEVQWKFHQEKARLLKENGSLDKLPAPYNLGFNTMSIWGILRHPNYLGEQGIWFSIYFFVVGAGLSNYGIFNWSFVPALLLIFLFLGSSELGESISSSKYPLYQEYQAQVFKYLPIRKFKLKNNEEGK